MRNVWFDVAVVVQPEVSPPQLQRIAARIRQLGVERVLYGSDAATNALAYPRAGWAAFRRLPLSEAEFHTIATNVTPYMRDLARPQPSRRTPAPSITVADIAGCYDLAHGAYSHESRLGPHAPTTLVRLDTTVQSRGPRDQYIAVRLAPAETLAPGSHDATWKRPAFWRIVRGDSVEIIMWATATEAESFDGRFVDNRLRGVVRLTGDAIPMDPKTHRIDWNAWPWAAAEGTRVACPR
jgi:hypothetical protein